MSRSGWLMVCLRRIVLIANWCGRSSLLQEALFPRQGMCKSREGSEQEQHMRISSFCFWLWVRCEQLFKSLCLVFLTMMGSNLKVQPKQTRPPLTAVRQFITAVERKLEHCPFHVMHDKLDIQLQVYCFRSHRNVCVEDIFLSACTLLLKYQRLLRTETKDKFLSNHFTKSSRYRAWSMYPPVLGEG